MSLSLDGTTLAVGAPGQEELGGGNQYQQRVYFYDVERVFPFGPADVTFTYRDMIHYTNDIPGTDPLDVGFGSSVDLNIDGSEILIGHANEGAEAGAVYYWERTGGSYNLLQHITDATDGSRPGSFPGGQNTQLGRSVKATNSFDSFTTRIFFWEVNGHLGGSYFYKKNAVTGLYEYCGYFHQGDLVGNDVSGFDYIQFTNPNSRKFVCSAYGDTLDGTPIRAGEIYIIEPLP
jgi:hypothetical protein